MAKRSEKLQVETKGEARIRRQRTLLGLYAACPACVPHFVRLSTAWTPVFAILTVSGCEQAQSSNEAAAYERALSHIVRDGFGLADEEGNALRWAKDWVHSHSVRSDYENSALTFREWGAFRPSTRRYSTDASIRLPGLAIHVWEDSVAVHVPGWEKPDYLDTDYGALSDVGFDYNDLSKLTAQIRKAAEEAIVYGERRLRELPVNQGGIRPSTIDREARGLGTLHYHLITAEPLRIVEKHMKPTMNDGDVEPCGCPRDRGKHGGIALSRPKWNRVRDLAHDLRIRCPRLPTR